MLPGLLKLAGTDSARARFKRIIDNAALCLSLLPNGCDAQQQCIVAGTLWRAACVTDMEIGKFQAKAKRLQKDALNDIAKLRAIADRWPAQASALRDVSDAIQRLAGAGYQMPQFARVRPKRKGKSTPEEIEAVRRKRMAALILHYSTLKLTNEDIGKLLDVSADNVGEWVNANETT